MHVCWRRTALQRGRSAEGSLHAGQQLEVDFRTHRFGELPDPPQQNACSKIAYAGLNRLRRVEAEVLTCFVDTATVQERLFELISTSTATRGA